MNTGLCRLNCLHDSDLQGFQAATRANRRLFRARSRLRGHHQDAAPASEPKTPPLKAVRTPRIRRVYRRTIRRARLRSRFRYDRQLHLICDNYATHKHPKVQRWLARHPRFHLHFTPTSASWLNMVERFFRDLTQNRLRRGVFRDLEELIMAIGTYIDRHNESPKPFIWTARAADILEKVKRARRTLNKRRSV